MKPTLCTLWLAGVLLLGCTPDEVDSGTSVGNPTTTSIRIGPADGLVYSEAFAGVQVVALHECGAEWVEAPVEGVLDLRQDSVELPPGDWCELELILFEPLHAAGVGELGGTFEVHLDIGFVHLESQGGVTFDDGFHVFEVGTPGWLSAGELGVADGVDVFVDPEAPMHDDLVARAHETSALFVDDGDGEISQDERDAGSVAGPPAVIPDDPVQVPVKCGCASTGPAAAPTWSLFLVAAAWARRRRVPRGPPVPTRRPRRSRRRR